MVNSIAPTQQVAAIRTYPDETRHLSCTTLTTTSNGLIKPLHDRTPVILAPNKYDKWLDHHAIEPEMLKPLFKHYSSELMEMYPVSDLVNSPRNDTPECIKPLES
jgi:putative SOS response-associated peptidase YedK